MSQVEAVADKVKCPHCPKVFDLTLEPEVNFTRVWIHMVEAHFEIAFMAMVKINAIPSQ